MTLEEFPGIRATSETVLSGVA